MFPNTRCFKSNAGSKNQNFEKIVHLQHLDIVLKMTILPTRFAEDFLHKF